MNAADSQVSAPFRLTIAHLLLWTATTAFVVAAFPKYWLRVSLPVSALPAEQLVARQRAIENWSVVAVSPFYGVAVASVVVAGVRLLQRRPGFPAQPGHWLLVQTGLGILTASFFVGAANDLWRFSNAELHAVRRTHGAIVLGLVASLAVTGVVACRATPEPRRWRLLLRLHAAAAGAPLLAFLVVTNEMVSSNPPSIFWIILVFWASAVAASLAALASDLVRRMPYDLAHYTGIAIPVVMLLHPPLTRWLAELIL